MSSNLDSPDGPQTREIRDLTSEIRAAGFHYSASVARLSVQGEGDPRPGAPSITPVGENADAGLSSKMPMWVKLTFGAPQFSIFSIYMLISVHCTIYYEKLGAKVGRPQSNAPCEALGTWRPGRLSRIGLLRAG